MTDKRSDDIDGAMTDDAGIAIDPETIIPPEQPPMDDAAGGPQADPSDEPLPETTPAEEEVAAQLGDFA